MNIYRKLFQVNLYNFSNKASVYKMFQPDTKFTPAYKTLPIPILSTFPSTYLPTYTFPFILILTKAHDYLHRYKKHKGL